MSTVPTAYTWTVGELVTAAKLNAYMRDALAFLLARPAATLTNTAPQSIPTSTGTALTWNLEILDSDEGHSTSANTSRYTVQTAGLWTFTANVPFGANSTGVREVYFRTNGGFDFSANLMGTGQVINHSLSITDKIAMNVGDYVEVLVRQTSGVALNVDSTLRGGQRFHALWERT